MLEVKLDAMTALDLDNGPSGLKILEFKSEQELNFIIKGLWGLQIKGRFIYKKLEAGSFKVGEIMEMESI